MVPGHKGVEKGVVTRYGGVGRLVGVLGEHDARALQVTTPYESCGRILQTLLLFEVVPIVVGLIQA